MPDRSKPWYGAMKAGVRDRLYAGLHRRMMGRSLAWLERIPERRRNQVTTAIRARNWDLYLRERKATSVRVQCMPASLNLQTTWKCNFRCIMCVRQKDGFKPNREYPCMDEDLLRKIAHEGFAYASSIDLTVSGEPLLASNLDETLRLARLHNVPLNITTNGSLLGRPGMIEKLMPSLGILAVSLDAASPETLAKIRPGARFDDIVAALSAYCKVRRARRKGGEVRIAAVLMRENIEELPEMVRLAHSVGVDKLSAAHMVVVSPALEEQSLLHYRDLFNRCRAEAVAVAESLGQTVVLPPPLDEQDAVESQGGQTEPPGPVQGPIWCPFSHHSMYVQADGDVTPCCNEDPDLPVMGNVRSQPIWEIWNSKRYLELREGLRTGRLTSYCRRCYIIADFVRIAGRGLIKAKRST